MMPLIGSGERPDRERIFKNRNLFFPSASHSRLQLIAIAVLLLACCQSGPPKEAGNFRQPDLVEVTRLDPSIRLDIRYATTSCTGPCIDRHGFFCSGPQPKPSFASTRV